MNRQSLLTATLDLSLYPSPNRAGWRMQREAPAEMHDLKQVVAYRQADFAMRDVGLDLGLLSKLKHSIYVFRKQLLTVTTKHHLHQFLSRTHSPASRAAASAPCEAGTWMSPRLCRASPRFPRARILPRRGARTPSGILEPIARSLYLAPADL